MSDLVHTLPDVCLRDPYELEAWLAAFPAAERDVVARGIAASLGHESLARWKEHHAFGVALGRPLDEFPRGTYAFFYCGEEPLRDRPVLAEELEPPDLDLLAEEAGLDPEEVDEMDDEELCAAIEEALGEGVLDEGSDGFFKHAEAPSLFELLRIMVANRDLGIDPDPAPSDAIWRDEKLGEEHAHLRPIRDLSLRRVAAELDGGGWQLTRTDDYDEATDCQGILARRPGWEFLCGWYGLPPNECGGACILYLPAGEDDEEAPPGRTTQA